MSFSNPYQAYAEGSVYSGNPLQLVVPLYEGTIESIRRARQCLATGDIMARSAAINKAFELLTQLLVSLDHEQGGDIAANLKNLYSYIQSRLLDGHAQKSEEALKEAERLLDTMLEGWREAAQRPGNAVFPVAEALQIPEIDSQYETAGYGFFSEELSGFSAAVSAVF
ncbi:MAG: flagellar export chaperone FliS [Acidobacteriota bacterium]|nr:flagellar export chaperone FliS [Acidobacteriota bacterium]